ncbi:MAG: prepilin-type N-terminal cleavage/methylation domain-containing protein [Pseudomonadota bacterium]
MNGFSRDAEYTGHGFTLMEVVTVLVVVGIAAAVAVSRMSVMDSGQIGDLEKIKSHLRYAQSKAMADSSIRWGIVFSGTTYSLFRNTNTDAVVDAGEKQVLPGESSNIVSLDSGLSVNAIVAFDWWGAPYSNANCVTPMTSGILSFSGGKTIVITPDTGFIP